MLTLKEKAINNTFQILEDSKSISIRESFYCTFKKARSPKVQPPGKVKIFSEEEILLYKEERR